MGGSEESQLKEYMRCIGIGRTRPEKDLQCGEGDQHEWCSLPAISASDAPQEREAGTRSLNASRMPENTMGYE